MSQPWSPPPAPGAAPNAGPPSSNGPPRGHHARTASLALPASPGRLAAQQGQQGSPPAAGPPSSRRRQYAAATFYDSATPSGPPIGGHAHTQSLSGAPGQGTFFSPAADPLPPSSAAQAQGYFAPGAAPVGGQDYQGVQYGTPPAGAPHLPPASGVGGMTAQFGGMGIGGQGMQQPMRPVAQTINLIGLPVNPMELFYAPPPQILLPQGATFSPSPHANADPSYQRSTLNAVPTTNSLLNKSKLPLALVLTPYRSLKAGEDEVPVVSDTVIARCRRCRTYINPYVTFIEGGQRWKCCMCGLSNEVPQLFDWDQAANAPADRWARAELNHAVVEFVAPTEYMVRPPQPPVYVFLVDVSYAAVNSGMVATAARTLLESLERLPNAESRTKIAFIAVDSSLHFFALPEGASEPQMLVVGDLDDMFLPRPQDLLVNLTEARAGVEALLAKLSDLYKDTTNTGCAMGAALQVAYKMISHVGGKISVLSASLPNMGPGKLANREDPKALGTSKESALLQAQNGFYKNFAIDCSRSQVSVDMWLFGSGYTDVATLSGLPRYTGGQTYFYPGFNASRSEDALKFAHEFGTVLSSPICLEAVMRVRASRGLRMSAFHGNFFVRSTDLLSLPAVPIDQSYAIEIQIEDPLSQPFVVFQTAVLHTTSYGERRIRVVTLALPTTSSISDLYSSIDAQAMATVLVDKAVERATQSKLEDARDAVTNKMVDILGTFKATMTASGSGASPQLVCSENMKFLPILMLGLLKHLGIRQSSQIPSDLRAYAQALLTTMPTQLLLPYLHPVFYSLHNMPKECGTITEDGVVLPPPLPLTSERLERHGLFLLEDGQNIFLWLGRDAVPQLVLDVFNIPSYSELRGGKTTLPVLENQFSQRVNAIIGKVREQRRGCYYPHLYVVKEDGEPSLRQWALSCLIEDRMEGLPSYVQWLGTLKDKVNDKSF